jgi:arginase
VLQVAVDSGRVIGLEVTIFNPTLDRDGSIARELVGCLARSITNHDRQSPQHP